MEAALYNFVLDRVLLAIEQSTHVGDLVLTSATRIAEDLGLRGFGLVKLALYIEEIFDVELSDEALTRFNTVADIVRHLTRNYFQDADFARSWTRPSQDLV